MTKAVPIVSIPNSVLTTQAKPVTAIDGKIRTIIAQMKATLLAANKPKGVGLAAPQIGIPLRIFITKPNEKSDFTVFVNPQILEKSKELGEIEREGGSKEELKNERKLEGCLSIPNVWGHLVRHRRVKVQYQDESGKENIRDFSGFMATIIQHETDHLNGVLFPQRVLEQNEKLYEIEEDKDGKDKLVEIEI